MGSLRQLWSSFREWRRGPKGIVLTLALVLLAAGAFFSSDYRYRSRDVIDYPSKLDEVVVTVDGVDRTLGDLAYYVGRCEMEGQKNALRMDPEHPRSYWNTLVKKGRGVKEQTRDQAMAMAVHDEIFYQMAVREKITLSGEERKALLDHKTDFLEDLEDHKGLESLGITESELHSVMERVALAQRCQTIYALEQGGAYRDYEYDREGYLSMLEKHSYTVNSKLWARVDFGNVVVDNPLGRQ